MTLAAWLRRLRWTYHIERATKLLLRAKRHQDKAARLKRAGR